MPDAQKYESVITRPDGVAACARTSTSLIILNGNTTPPVFDAADPLYIHPFGKRPDAIEPRKCETSHRATLPTGAGDDPENNVVA